jgi:hypothetical protein
MSKQNELAQLADAVTVDGSNVGIRTDSPSADLHIASGSANAPHILLENTVSSGADPSITFADSVENYGYRIGIDDTGNGLAFTYKSGGINPIHGVDSERMRIDSSGAVTIPSQPAFMAVKNAGQLNMPINIYNTVTFGNEVFDRNADYNGSTTFTAPVTGVYQANIKIRIDQIDNQANYYLVRLQTSNRHYYTITDFDGSTGDLSYSTHSFSQLIDMDAGDTAYVQAYQSGGSVQSDYDNDSGSSQFSMFLVA